MIDFSSAKQMLNTYDGVAAKIKIYYEGRIYMLKFDENLVPDKKNQQQASYANTTISEYLGSHVFSSCGIKTQDTLLGTFNNQKVVACEDFILNQNSAHPLQLIEFALFETSFLPHSSGRTRTSELSVVRDVLEHHIGLEPIRQLAKDSFWDMTVVDALNGNFDRHAGNWGYIQDTVTDAVIATAPIYDCGSSYYPKLDENEMARIVNDREAMSSRILNFPRATLAENGVKLKYQELLLRPDLPEIRQALLRVFPKINLERINRIIDDTPFMSDTKREFHKNLIALRKETVLKPAYEQAVHERDEESL